MKRTGLILGLTIGWLGGIVFAAHFLTTVLLWAGLGLTLITALAMQYVSAECKLLLIIVIGLILGLLRGQAYFMDQRFYAVEDLIGQRVSVTGRIADEPGWNADRMYEYYLTDLRVGGRATPGLLKIKAQVGNVYEGQTVSVTGKIGKALGKAPAQIWYATVKVVDARQPYPVRLKESLSRGLERALPRDQAGFLRGLLFGSRTAVPIEVEKQLRTVGLTHIVAVSGYNLTIIIAALALIVRRKSRLAVALTLAGIGLFVMMTGFAPSIVRAAIMGVVFLIAQRSRRQLDPWVAFALTVIIMTAWAPRYLLTDMSWQLSALALVGVLVVAPRLAEGNGLWGTLKEIILVSCAAHLATAPLIALRFGTFSLIAPLANLLILPLVPILMLGGILVAGFGVVVPGLAFGISWPLRFVVQLVLSLISSLSTTPHASFATGALNVGDAVTLYVILIILAVFVSLHSLRSRSGKNVTEKV